MGRLSIILLLSVVLVVPILYYTLTPSAIDNTSPQSDKVAADQADIDDKKVQLSITSAAKPPVKPLDISQLEKPGDIAKVGIIEE